ncbi:MAG: hypothetical protein ACE5JM_06475 [Armatimonadota bacterium]
MKGTYDGRAVVLRDSIDIPPNTEVEVLIPEPDEQGLPDVLARLDRAPAGETLSLEEVVALVHEVRQSDS